MGLEGAKAELEREIQEAQTCLEYLTAHTNKKYNTLTEFLMYLKLG